ncbi:protein involved in gliding motility GldE [Lishizhenia tianjinensis]|uniref:Protein involved in gliding motility GldE n=1 Tax=Lishizhenia tianjinensis TaxID=477690 RepID=A0A1I7A0J4_9FLAO|nr:gliding motility-associated protein GldE [Lishizhenia tianjinensis]SFT68440.1 protein involved in gliding motility GldE [Lishizhenia tianjinensis]
MDIEPASCFLAILNVDIELGISFVILAVLLLLSAMVSGSEVAFFSLGPTEKEELKTGKSKSAETTIALINDPKELLATILIANNFINVGIVILSSYVFGQIYPEDYGIPWVRTLIEVAGITFIILLIGEVIPKVYANRNPLKLSLFMSKPIYSIGRIPPISWMKLGLVRGTDFINKAAKKRSLDVSTDDLENALELTREENDTEDDHRILEGIVKFGNTDVRQIMRSRLDVTAIEENASYKELMDVILDAGFSRIPVYKENFDDVIGIVYIKDLLPHLNEAEDFNWQSLLRTPFFVPENKKIDDLLKEFQDMKMHMAVVVDEYGGASGIVTLEDVLEEIVGDITDEFDDDDLVYTKVDDSTYVFEGKTPLVDLYKVLDIDGKNFEEAKGESDSIAGFIIEQAGKILKNNEYIIFNHYKFVVESSDKRRVKMVKVIVLNDVESK